MSYFITISGKNAESVEVPSGRLIPIREAQSYLAKLAALIEAADGSPSLWWDDGETETSTELVCAAEEDIFEDRLIEESALGKVIERCESLHTVIRIWWASDDADPFKLPTVKNAAEAYALIQSDGSKGFRLAFVLQPTAERAV
ncbi:hypothetical protein ELE36_15340 [Pseudolysobacter antarcticus]|uniref:Uncharacterized protein n=1 Tax=Pseudolysobacter antarcticus TaxID=2511995 RepID=A0A411HMG2_9GAMM|nr:hypothetical protein [Pseudolysobacter antarcticus]QBB71620.1 hypothetical protein ELE36_15340 [Pseudolysobacter antarcticus]